MSMDKLKEAAQHFLDEGIELGRLEERELILAEIRRCIRICQETAELCKGSDHTEALGKHRARESELTALLSRIERGLK